MQGDKTGYDCPLCRNKGFIAKVRNGVMALTECECMVRRRSMKRIEDSGLKPVIENYRFDNFLTESKWQRDAKSIAADFLERGSGWFVMVGSPGSGKTHLCTAICGKLIERNKSVRYMVWRRDAPRLKASVNDRSVYDKIMDDFDKADVLYIDDFWKGTISEADINLAFELLNSRYNNRSKITIISSEKTIEDILDIDEAIGSRIYERSKGAYIVTQNQNWRLMH